MSDRSTVLFELGTEELPPHSIERLATALAQGLTRRLSEAGIDVTGQVKSYSTPRRLAVQLVDILNRQPDRTEQRLGPAVAAAFDQQGAPTQAAAGFARSCGTAVENLEQVDGPKGPRLAWTNEITGSALADLLPSLIQATLDELPVARPMRWGNRSIAFVRPVHWVVLLVDADIVDAEFFGLQAGRITHGHRVHHPKPIPLTSAPEYIPQLESGFVLADPIERRARIADQIKAVADACGLTAVVPDTLLSEVTNLVEWPVAMSGQFSESFLEVPEEAVISSLQSHQKMFPLRNDSNALSNTFITVANLESTAPDEVRRGYERVVEPRLADAQFFWLKDGQTSLADRRPKLDSVTFQQKLGTIGDKVVRMQMLGKVLGREFDLSESSVSRAIDLCKCDLLTDMVGEFPELQGIMGSRYAAAQNEDSDVATAIEEHYQPRFAGDSVPESPLGRVVGLADRIDTLVGIFAAGLKPTGNKDPFALRRGALGLIRIVVEGKVSLDLRSALELATGNLPEGLADADCLSDLQSFIWDRARGYFAERAIPGDVFDAVYFVQDIDLYDFYRRSKACEAFRSTDEAQSLAGANKRVANILRKADDTSGKSVNENLLQEESERALNESLNSRAELVSAAVSSGDYGEALRILGGLRSSVDRFFDEVLVMDPDESLRQNRLALLQQMRALFLLVADVGRLSI